MSKELTFICIILLALFADLLCLQQTLGAAASGEEKMSSDWISIAVSELMVAATLFFCLVLIVRKVFSRKL